MPLTESKKAFQDVLPSLMKDSDISKKVAVTSNGDKYELAHGSVVISAITSCTNTSNPSVLIGAGLLARNAVEKGLHAQAMGENDLAPDQSGHRIFKRQRPVAVSGTDRL